MTILFKDIENDGLYEGQGEKNYYQDKGEKGEKQISEKLMNSLSNDYGLLNGVYVRTDDGDFTELDHILLHPQFILCIETKFFSGDLRALDVETWEQTNRKNGKTTKIDSPQQQAVHHAFSLKSYLDSIDITLPIFTVVVLVDAKGSMFDKESDTFYLSECPVITSDNLIHLIEIMEHQTNSNTTSYEISKLSSEIQNEHEGIKNSKLFWYKKEAMNKNDREAQFFLGHMYLMGYYEGENNVVQVKQNEKAALYWLNKASKKGHQIARKTIRQYFKN